MLQSLLKIIQVILVLTISEPVEDLYIAGEGLMGWKFLSGYKDYRIHIRVVYTGESESLKLCLGIV